MFGTAGGIVGPIVVGVLVGRTGNFALGIGLLALLLVAAGTGAVIPTPHLSTGDAVMRIPELRQAFSIRMELGAGPRIRFEPAGTRFRRGFVAVLGGVIEGAASRRPGAAAIGR